MNLTELFTPKIIAANYTEAASNAIPYLGSGLFPSVKRAGLDLAWIKGHKGLPVSLKPSAFDAKATFRDRIGVSKLETEMPFFREGYKIKEKDRQEILRAQSSNDPYAADVINRIYDDQQDLIAGADVVPERMRMHLSMSAQRARSFPNTMSKYPGSSFLLRRHTALEMAPQTLLQQFVRLALLWSATVIPKLSLTAERYSAPLKMKHTENKSEREAPLSKRKI